MIWEVIWPATYFPVSCGKPTDKDPYFQSQPEHLWKIILISTTYRISMAPRKQVSKGNTASTKKLKTKERREKLLMTTCLPHRSKSTQKLQVARLQLHLLQRHLPQAAEEPQLWPRKKILHFIKMPPSTFLTVMHHKTVRTNHLRQSLVSCSNFFWPK